jgi:flavin-binding protein dodecin
VKIIEVIGNSDKSWEDATMNALMDASQTIRNISGIEIVSQNANVEDGKITQYRSVVKIAFGYERE